MTLRLSRLPTDLQPPLAQHLEHVAMHRAARERLPFRQFEV
jgi:hypothetical protein